MCKGSWVKSVKGLQQGKNSESRATYPLFTNLFAGTISGGLTSMDHSEMGKRYLSIAYFIVYN